MHYTEVFMIYEGSNGDATKAFYARLEALGPAGFIAANLFRAHKSSVRAKLYRGGDRRGSYRGMAYDRKQWALGNLCTALEQHAGALGLTWGWKPDPRERHNPHVLYVDTPHGQVSFHSPVRGAGPDYPGEWDGVRMMGHDRICRWCSRLLTEATAATERREQCLSAG